MTVTGIGWGNSSHKDHKGTEDTDKINLPFFLRALCELCASVRGLPHYFFSPYQVSRIIPRLGPVRLSTVP